MKLQKQISLEEEETRCFKNLHFDTNFYEQEKAKFLDDYVGGWRAAAALIIMKLSEVNCG